jgi:hypothetical protein
VKLNRDKFTLILTLTIFLDLLFLRELHACGKTSKKIILATLVLGPATVAELPTALALDAATPSPLVAPLSFHGSSSNPWVIVPAIPDECIIQPSSPPGIYMYSAVNNTAYKKVVRECILKPRRIAGTQLCNHAPASWDDDHSYSESEIDPAANLLLNSNEKFNYHSWFIREIYKINSDSDKLRWKDITEFDMIVDELKNFQAHHNLSECETMKLVNCATTNIISYDLDAVANSFSVSHIVQSQKGVCSHFAILAWKLSAALGLQVRIVLNTLGFSDPHAYNSIMIDSQEYYFEPQDKTGTLFPAECKL